MWIFWIFFLGQIVNVENEDSVPGTPLSENPSQPPNFAHLCGQCGFGTWYPLSSYIPGTYIPPGTDVSPFIQSYNVLTIFGPVSFTPNGF